MTNLYKALPRKQLNYYPAVSGQNEVHTILRLEIADSFTTYCTKPLVLSLSQMNKELTQIIVNDLIARGRE